MPGKNEANWSYSTLATIKFKDVLFPGGTYSLKKKKKHKGIKAQKKQNSNLELKKMPHYKITQDKTVNLLTQISWNCQFQLVLRKPKLDWHILIASWGLS